MMVQDKSGEICIYTLQNIKILELSTKVMVPIPNRNYGLRSKGEYIVFVDSDDYIEPYV